MPFFNDYRKSRPRSLFREVIAALENNANHFPRASNSHPDEITRPTDSPLHQAEAPPLRREARREMRLRIRKGTAPQFPEYSLLPMHDMLANLSFLPDLRFRPGVALNWSSDSQTVWPSASVEQA